MTSDTRSHQWARRLHAQLLVCYPRAFRERFGPEVRETFDRRLKVADGRGRFALALCLLLAFADVVL